MFKIQHGNEWAEENLPPLALLLARLDEYTLSPMFFADYPVMTLAHRSRHAGYDRCGRAIHEDAGPMFPEAPHAVEFFGNFEDLSAGFTVTTDDAEIIEVLLAAIQANLATPRYAAALAKHRERERYVQQRNAYIRKHGHRPAG